jgi:hypothetical protein
MRSLSQLAAMFRLPFLALLLWFGVLYRRFQKERPESGGLVETISIRFVNRVLTDG